MKNVNTDINITKKSLYESVADKLQNLGYSARVSDDYSGRGMSGQTCIGITTDAPSALIGSAVELSAIEDGIADAYKYQPRRSDSMGKQTIYY